MKGTIGPGISDRELVCSATRALEEAAADATVEMQSGADDERADAPKSSPSLHHHGDNIAFRRFPLLPDARAYFPLVVF